MEVIKVNEFSGHKAGIYALHRGRKDHLIYASGGDEHLVEWNLYEPHKSKAVAKLPYKGYSIAKIEYLNILLVGNFSGGIHVIDLIEGKEIKLLKTHESIVFDILVLAEKEEFIAVSGDGSFSVWSTKDFTLSKQVKLTTKRLRSLDLSPNNKLLAIGCSDNTTRIIETNTFKEIEQLTGDKEDRFVNKAVFHPAKDILITGSRGFLSFWDTTTFTLINRIAAHQFSIYGIVFNPKGTLFATSSMDKTIRIWDANTFKLLTEINRQQEKGHTNSINTLLWSNYNDYLISGGDDRKVMVWRVIE